MTSTTRSRFGTFGSGNSLAAAEQSRNSHGSSLGPGLGNASGAWNNGGIWGNTAIGSGLKNTSNENAPRFPDDRSAITSNSETMTGSGSLLSNSESDSWSGHQRTPWKSNDDTSLGLASAGTQRTGTSPLRRQNSSQRVPQAFTEIQPNSVSFFSVTPGASNNQGLPKGSQKQFLDPSSGSFAGSVSLEPEGYQQRPSRHNSDEENRYSARSMGFGNNDAAFMAQLSRQNTQSSASAFSSSVPSRSGSLPPSRSGMDTSQRFDADIQHPTFTQIGRQNGANGHRSDLSISRTANNYGQRFGEHPSPTTMAQLSDNFAKMGVTKENYDLHRDAGYSSQHVPPYEFLQQADPSVGWDIEDHGTRDGRDAYGQYNIMPLQQQNEYRNAVMNASYSHSPTSSDARRNQYSPNYSANGSSPYLHQNRASSRGSHPGNVPARQTLILDQKLRGLQQEQQGFVPPQTNPLPFRNPYTGQYEVHLQNARLNTLNPYYPIQPVPNFLPSQTIPRGPAKDQDASQHMRSQCLEEFRSNSKTNKRYELKDIYNHIVEFSGDQHGSRFIQQKLETANSDEKDQVFKEILPNTMQLMTDVFGNYVIQKFFEHGNQSQKKTIANQMKNHVLTLSLQMYGCRVVQKALEHILTDQQASLIRELQKDNQIMRCVKDQNGNHVIQKAIERIPAEHIQFIVNAFTGQVHELSKHAYGCRVIQRMLEHCVEPTRTALLEELHGCAHYLIGDTYGNYVTQHVIEHGREADRNRIISLVTSNLIEYSKHKFASNVVETCVKFGNVEQRKMIVDILTAVNEKGESKLQFLIRDQYCNYVIQKLLIELKGDELDSFVDILKAQMVILKKFAFGKQIQAIDRLLYSTTPQQPSGTRSASLVPPPIDTSASAAPSPPLLTGDGQSPQSSSVPSTNASSVAGPTDSRKSSASNAIEVMTPTST